MTDRPCVMHPVDDCSAALPCVDCPVVDAAHAYVNARREFESNQPQLRYAKKRVNELYARLAALIPDERT